MADLKSLADTLVALSIKEVSELADILKDEHGIEPAAAAVAVAAAPGAGGDAGAKQTEFNFPVLANYTPNVFVNISLLQKHSQTINDLPIRMYGSIPMLVHDPATKLAPEITLADELRPESTAKINVKEKNGKAKINM